MLVGPKIAFFHMMRYILIYWFSLCVNDFPDLFYRIVFRSENDIF